MFWLERWYFIRVVDVDADLPATGLVVVDADDDAVGVDVVHHAAGGAATHGAPSPSRRRAPRRCPPGPSRAQVGTAWRCMLAPISARFASSCSRKGTSEAATETICVGATSMYWMRSGEVRIDSPLSRAADQLVDPAVVVERGVGLRDDVLAFLDGREVVDLVGDPAVGHAAVRRSREAVLVELRVQGQRVDQADVRAFRRLDRADAAVVRRVHVAHLEAGALARQAARAEGRDAPLVRDLRQRVGLVHELRQLRGAEESFRAAEIGFELIRSCGISASVSA